MSKKANEVPTISMKHKASSYPAGSESLSEGKGVDVGLAADLLLYGMTGDYDAAILASGDSDYIPVLKKLAERKPNLKIEVAQFRGQVSYDLRNLGFRFHPLDDIAEQFRRTAA